MTEEELEIIRPLVRRRSQREPLQYILGHVDFSGLKIKVDKRALIPRPETEFLIEKIKDKLSSKSPLRILDLGTGSGAIALALAKCFSEANVTAIDASQDALALTSENIQSLGFSDRVKPLFSTWYDAVRPTSDFDLIISNPPYLTLLEVNQAMPEVNKHEPLSALIADDNGLKDIKIIISQAKKYLAPHGIVALETGENQHEAIKAIASSCGFTQFSSEKDLASKDRYVFISI